MTGRTPEGLRTIGRAKPSMRYRVVRALLVVWAVAYPVVSFGPIVVGLVLGGDTGSMATVTGAVLGGVLFIPWLIGLGVLGLAAWATR